MKLSLKQVFISSIIGLILITVSSIMISTYYSTQTVLIGHAHKIMSSVATDTINRSKDFLKPAQIAADLTQNLANFNIVNEKDINKLERYFFEQLKLYPYFSGIYFGTEDGGMTFVSRFDNARYRTKLISFDENGKRSVLLKWRDSKFNLLDSKQDQEDEYDPRTRPWYQKATSERRLIWTDPYIFYSSQKPGITTAMPVYDFNKMPALTGVVGVDIEISDLSKFLSHLEIGASGSAFIINKNGDVIAHPDKTKLFIENNEGIIKFQNINEINDPLALSAFQSLNLSDQEILDFNTNITSHFTVDNTKYQTIFSPFNDRKWPWFIGIYVPENDFIGQFKENQKLNIYIALSIGLVAILFGFFLASSMSKPIVELGFLSKRVKEGNYDIDDQIHSNHKEIQETSDCFLSMASSLKLKQKQNKALEKSLKKTSLATIHRLAEAAEYKDHDTAIHISRMSRLAQLIAQQMGLSMEYSNNMLYAAPMHDIGKIGIPDSILLKPGKLTHEEFLKVQEHPAIGASILKNPETNILKMAREIALTHHEKWNGTGYPSQLKGEAIPLCGRITALADVFDALASKRCYKEAFDLDLVFKMIQEERGQHFDPECVDALMSAETEARNIYSNIHHNETSI